ncbi:MAG: hypothetical protein RR933_08660 [Oscillospiraceae bacterium]
MDKYIIYGVFFFSMLCFPAYFLLLFLKKRKEKNQAEDEKGNKDERQLIAYLCHISNILLEFYMTAISALPQGVIML